MQLLDLNDSKDAVYGALDAWVAWEQKFPIASIKQVLIALEKEQQWHRIVQVWYSLSLPLPPPYATLTWMHAFLNMMVFMYCMNIKNNSGFL